MFKYRLQKYYLFLILTSFYRLIYHILETKCTALAKDGERHPHRPRTPSTQIANAVGADCGHYTTTKVDVLFDKS